MGLPHAATDLVGEGLALDAGGELEWLGRYSPGHGSGHGHGPGEHAWPMMAKAASLDGFDYAAKGRRLWLAVHGWRFARLTLAVRLTVRRRGQPALNASGVHTRCVGGCQTS